MVRHRFSYARTTEAAIFPGTTVRYHYRTGDSLATVVERTDRFVTFIGPDCDGRFTHDQIDRLIDDDRLEVVLDDEYHVPDDERPVLE
ncbi:hypothetical protein [Natronolimnobius baerhuensis]|uniref:Uncharacterized protein n=1 Tax=Natronolimnobius baerhuensis TaxID=253108 RepID=A0A202E6B3_9EURY|nr:hypothetical protein [Natronolimnobius baerhuensis]OVE83812.1 hypothetical protein B2G88_15440 [Natronolimnobius baerhuensis]